MAHGSTGSSVTPAHHAGLQPPLLLHAPHVPPVPGEAPTPLPPEMPNELPPDVEEPPVPDAREAPVGDPPRHPKPAVLH